MLSPAITSISSDGDRIVITYTGGRVCAAPSILILRHSGESFNLCIRGPHSGVYLKGVGSEHAGALRLLGVEVAEAGTASRGWHSGTFRAALTTGSVWVCGSVRRGLGVFRLDSSAALPWSLTDVTTGMAIGFYRTASSARHEADAVETDPVRLATLEAAREAHRSATAGRKAALTKGPEGLRSAALKAAATRLARRAEALRLAA